MGDDDKPKVQPNQENGTPKSASNSLEIAKVVLLGALFPAVGFFISYEIRAHDDRVTKAQQDARDKQTAYEAQRHDEMAKLEAAAREQQAFRKSLWDSVGIKLNRIYCYFFYIGDWKSTSRNDIIALKRELDSTMWTNKAFFSEPFFNHYQAFMGAVFKTDTGWPNDAQLRTVPIRPQDKGLPKAFFTCENNWGEIFTSYWTLMDSASLELFGLPTANPKDPPAPPDDYPQLAKDSACGGFRQK